MAFYKEVYLEQDKVLQADKLKEQEKDDKLKSLLTNENTMSEDTQTPTEETVPPVVEAAAPEATEAASTPEAEAPATDTATETPAA